MGGWIIGWSIGAAVVVAVVVLLGAAIAVTARVAARAEAIAGELEQARLATAPLWRLQHITGAMHGIRGSVVSGRTVVPGRTAGERELGG